MPEWVLVDTDILIDVGRGETTAVNCLSWIESSATPALSIITEMELIVGCKNKRELQQLDRMMRRYTILRLSETISEIARGLLRRYRLSHGLMVADALIAATSIQHSIPFISKNQRDYRFLGEEVNLLPYPPQ